MSITRKRLLVYLVMVISLLMVINLIKDIIRLEKSDQRLATAEQKRQLARQEQAETKRQLAKATDGFWLESQIRNVLKMAKPEEVIVVVPEVVTERAKEVEVKGETAADQESNFNLWLKVFGF